MLLSIVCECENKVVVSLKEENDYMRLVESINESDGRFKAKTDDEGNLSVTCKCGEKKKIIV